MGTASIICGVVLLLGIAAFRALRKASEANPTGAMGLGLFYIIAFCAMFLGGLGLVVIGIAWLAG